MASVRLKKKQLKRNMKLSLQQSLNEINTLNLEIAEAELEVAKLQATLKKKKVTINQLQMAISSASTLSEKAINKIASDVHKYSLGYNGSGDHAEHYAAIKKYNDFIDRGLIKRQSFLDKYEVKDFMERIMSEEEYEDYINEANKKAEELLKKSRERAAQTPEMRWGF